MKIITSDPRICVPPIMESYLKTKIVVLNIKYIGSSNNEWLYVPRLNSHNKLFWRGDNIKVTDTYICNWITFDGFDTLINMFINVWYQASLHKKTLYIFDSKEEARKFLTKKYKDENNIDPVIDLICNTDFGMIS